MLGQREFRAGRAQAVNHFDGYDISRPDSLLALRNVAVDDFVELEILPKPMSQPNVAELTRVGPSHRLQIDADEVRVVARSRLIVIRKEAELKVFALLIVEPDGALPAPLLIVVELAEVGDDALSRSGL